MSSSADTPPPSTSDQHSSKKLVILSIVSLFVAVLLAAFGYGFSAENTNINTTAKVFGFRRFFRTQSATAAAVVKKDISTSSAIPKSDNTMRTPVYFLSHGGPNIMYDRDHPAYRKLGEIGREITTKVKPRAVVVFSAHWQAGRNTIQVNTAEMTDLIYDFYGFPSHYYKEKFPNVGSKEVANKVLDALTEAGIKAEGVKRGLDHGVWASFKCAFDPDSNPLNVPIVQVSLFNTEDAAQHYQLGQAVSKLRDENILIIVSGMAVHNLRDLQLTWGNPKPMPYTASFDEALKDAVTKPPAEREQAMIDLLKRPDARQAHPSFDHLLPIYIGAGAAGDDLGKRLWTQKEGSMSWAQYRFGDVGDNSAL